MIPHPPNFAPITALALFGGTYLNRKYAFIIPLLVMFVSDIFIGFHSAMVFVYPSFVLSGLIGLWIKKHKSVNNIILGTFLSSFLFFLITNFGIWFIGDMYPHNVSGLLEEYRMGIPFYRNTLLGDFFYTSVFFVSYEIVSNYLTINKSKFKTQKSKIQFKI
jgi:hypothetical protein